MTARRRPAPGTAEHVSDAAQKLQDARLGLEAAIVAMRRAGASQAAIATAAGLTSAGVCKMLQRLGVDVEQARKRSAAKR